MHQIIDFNIDDIDMFTAPFFSQSMQATEESFWQESHKTPDNILKQFFIKGKSSRIVPSLHNLPPFHTLHNCNQTEIFSANPISQILAKPIRLLIR